MKREHDPVLVVPAQNFISQILKESSVEKIQAVSHERLDQAWRKWLCSSSFNFVNGLDTMPYSAFSAGTTQSFGEFIARHPRRRVRASRNDFKITKILCRTWGRNYLDLEDADLDQDDCLILSLPFSGNGSYLPKCQTILDQADQLKIPVFLDGAYYGISHGCNYPLHRPCVTDFAVSLTKNIAGNNFRLGMRFTKHLVDDSLSAAQLASDIFDRLGAYISIALLEKFSHDWWVKRYLDSSRTICRDHGLFPTNTLTIGIGKEQHRQYQRGDYIRVCISDELSAFDS